MRTRERQVSIRARLALIYAAILGTALLLFGSSVYLVLQDQLARTFEARLLANVEHAAGAFAQDIDASGEVRPSRRLLGQLASTGGRVVVLDPQGAILADSAPQDGFALDVSRRDLSQAERDAQVVREIEGDGTGRMTIHRIVGGEGVTAGYVAWVDSTRQVSRLLTSVATAMVVGGILVVLLAALTGLAFARRALAPISEVTDIARGITLSGDLRARVAEGRAHDEVSDLAVAFNEMLAALLNSQETLRRFLADVSHQLRTPLTTVRASLDLAQRDDLPDPERDEILTDALDESERMARLIRDLLSLARAESGAPLELVPVELDALLVDSVRLQRQTADHVRMSVSSVEPAVVEGDPDRLRELFGILLDNSARYTPAGGDVVASLVVDGGQAVVRVEDTGIGLDDDTQTRLFERLYRGDGARRLQPSGTGLGLPIALWIVEAHGGSIELSQRAAGGTSAVVTLPLRHAAPASGAV